MAKGYSQANPGTGDIKAQYQIKYVHFFVEQTQIKVTNKIKVTNANQSDYLTNKRQNDCYYPVWVTMKAMGTFIQYSLDCK